MAFRALARALAPVQVLAPELMAPTRFPALEAFIPGALVMDWAAAAITGGSLLGVGLLVLLGGFGFKRIQKLGAERVLVSALLLLVRAVPGPDPRGRVRGRVDLLELRDRWVSR